MVTINYKALFRFILTKNNHKISLSATTKNRWRDKRRKTIKKCGNKAKAKKT